MIHPLSLESEAKVHAKSIESSVNDAISRKREVKQELGGTIDYRSIMKYLDEKYKRKQLPRGNSEKVHTKSIESSVNDAVSKIETVKTTNKHRKFLIKKRLKWDCY